MRNLGNNYKIFKIRFPPNCYKISQVDSWDTKWVPEKKKKKKLFSTFERQCILCFTERCDALACRDIYSPLQQEIWVFLKALLSQIYLMLKDFIGWYLLTSHKTTIWEMQAVKMERKTSSASDGILLLEKFWECHSLQSGLVKFKPMKEIWGQCGRIAGDVCTDMQPSNSLVCGLARPMPSLGGTLCNWRKDPVFAPP